MFIFLFAIKGTNTSYSVNSKLSTLWTVIGTGEVSFVYWSENLEFLKLIVNGMARNGYINFDDNIFFIILSSYLFDNSWTFSWLNIALSWRSKPTSIISIKFIILNLSFQYLLSFNKIPLTYAFICSFNIECRVKDLILNDCLLIVNLL